MVWDGAFIRMGDGDGLHFYLEVDFPIEDRVLLQGHRPGEAIMANDETAGRRLSSTTVNGAVQ